MKNTRAHRQEIACQQVLLEDSSVLSVQWMTLPVRHAGAVSPESLLERYLAHVRRFTLSLVRPVRSGAGIDFRLLTLGANLLSFTLPLAANEGSTRSVTLRISGGFLLHPEECGRGELSFTTEMVGEGMKVIVRLAGYAPLLLGSTAPPRWRKLLYRLTQALLHRIVTVRFLARLYHELEGHGTPIMVVRVRGTAGEDI